MATFTIADDGIPGLTLALRLRLKGHAIALAQTPPVALNECFTLPAPYRDLMLKSGGALEDVAALLAAPPREFLVDGRMLALPHVGSQAHAIANTWDSAAGEQWASMNAVAADIWSSLRIGAYTSRGSLPAFARAQLKDQRLRELLYQFVAGFGLDPDTVGDAAAVLPYLEQTFGRWTFASGLDALEAELRRRCSALGVVASDNDRSELHVDDFWADAFAAPARWWQRSSAATAQTIELGLPWIGMAAEFTADRIGRASASNVSA